MNERLQPIRVLHVVGILQRGGIETWLMHVLRHFNRDRIQIDFLVQTAHPGAYDNAVKELGCHIYVCPIHRTRPWEYARRFKAILQDQGPYDIVHSHVHHFSGLTLWLAQHLKVPVRIAHSHNDTSILANHRSWARRFYVFIMQQWIQKYATLGFAASQEAARDLFGANWQDDTRWRVLYYGIDLEPFTQKSHNLTAGKDFGIPPTAFVIGHIGRFEHQKNHPFLLKIAEELIARDTNIYLLMIGDGPLRPAISEKVAQSPYKSNLIFAGLRTDVADLMLNCMDILLLPSFYEGLPVVGIEAQAAGLPIVLSDTITSELDAISSLIHRVSLNQSASSWADIIMKIKEQRQPIPERMLGVSQLRNSPFNIKFSVQQLEIAYEQCIQQARAK